MMVPITGKVYLTSNCSFQLLGSFAWLSFTVYQCAAVVIESVFKMSRFMAIWRAIWIIIMLSLLFVSVLTTFNDHWLTSFGTPSICAFKNMNGNYKRQILAVVLVTLFAIVWVRCVGITWLSEVVLKHFCRAVSISYTAFSPPGR
jgi:hypothetical protein